MFQPFPAFMHPSSLNWGNGMNRITALSVVVLLAGAAGAAPAETTIRDSNLGAHPVRGQIQERVALAAGSEIEVHGMGGSVEVTAADVAEVRLDYRREAATQMDYDCESLRFEHGGNKLRIWLQRDPRRSCRVIHAQDRLQLSVPRTAAIALAGIGDSVRISGVDGLVRLSSIGDSATLDAVRQLRADSIGDSLRLSLTTVGPAGIQIDSVGDSVELRLPERIDARLEIDSVGDAIRGEVLGLPRSDDEDDHLSTVLGKGGPLISINSVGDSVVILR